MSQIKYTKYVYKNMQLGCGVEHIPITHIYDETTQQRRFIFDVNNVDDENIKIIKLIMENGPHKKYQIEARVDGELIIDPIGIAQRTKTNKIKKETYDEYLQIEQKINPKNYKWIHDIIDGLKEQESIIYNDQHFILIPDYKWDGKNMDTIHILAIAKNKNLKSLRSLTGNDVSLLTNILNISLEFLEKTYAIQKDKWRAYIHYHPSSWQFHVHFTPLNIFDVGSSIDKAHSLDQVIFNLTHIPNYYQMVSLNVITEIMETS